MNGKCHNFFGTCQFFVIIQNSAVKTNILAIISSDRFVFHLLKLNCFNVFSHRYDQVKEEMLFEALTTRKTVTVGEKLIVPYRLSEVMLLPCSAVTINITLVQHWEASDDSNNKKFQIAVWGLREVAGSNRTFLKVTWFVHWLQSVAYRKFVFCFCFCLSLHFNWI